jgi:hypothetical protein
VARRATEIKRLRQQNPNSLVVDVGKWISLMDNDPNRVERSIAYVKALNAMGYSAACVSPCDFRLGKACLLEAKQTAKFPLLACNIVDAATGKPMFEGSTVVPAGEMKVGVIGVSTRDDLSQFKPGGVWENSPFIQAELEGLKFLDPNDSVKREIARLPRGLSLIVVLSALSAQDNVALAKANPEIDLILTLSSIEELVKPPNWDELPREQRRLPRQYVVGSTYIMCGSETVVGQLLPNLQVALADGKVTSASVNVSRLTASIASDPEMRAMLGDYYAGIVKQMDLPPGEKRMAWASPENNPKAKYVGAEACRRCHDIEYQQWHDRTRHAHAWQNLQQRVWYFWPQCVSCHTTGYGYDSGFKVKDLTLSLRNVQCESCHGPASLHIADPSKQANIRAKPTRKHCDECHAGPLPKQCRLPMGHIGEYDKDYDAYWKAILHK